MEHGTTGVPAGRTQLVLGKLLIVLAGIIACQCILYGPSLAGRKVLLPLDLLAVKKMYLPRTAEVEKIVPHDMILLDLIEEFEPARQFAMSELRAGRFPQWTTYQYAGSPFIWPKFSPFLMLECCLASPVILAWTQLLMATVAGLGAYLFFRRALTVGFWAATIPAWCYPMTGFLVFWQGYPTSFAVYWFPWLLLAVDRTVRRASFAALLGLSGVTCLTLISGHLDVAGQVLLVSGLYAMWRLWDEHRGKWVQRQASKAVIALVAGWSLGFMLAAPHWLPLLEYAQTGARMASRSAGMEERPPVGLSALPQTVLPDMYGATRAGSIRISKDNQIESSAAAYTGVLATLLVAPLAWCSRRHRSMNLFWALLCFFALSWCLDVPVLVDLLRLPGLNMMSHNRLVFAASFAILALAAVGLEIILQDHVQRQAWFWLFATLLAGLCAWCVYRAIVLPGPIGWVSDIEAMHRIQAWYIRSYTVAALLCGLGVAGWLCLRAGGTRQRWRVLVLGPLMIGDLLWFAYGRSAQCSPELYYPRIPVLEQVANSTPGRVVGFDCLPATLAETHGLRDIRGYDSIDPGRLVELMSPASDTNVQFVDYALTQWFTPQAEAITPDGIRLSPILDMLGVRYVIFRGSPPSTLIHPVFQGPDYWVLVNRAALPRAFVPRRVEAETTDSHRLAKLAVPEFDPSAVAYVETPVNLPADCRGNAEIVAEIPTRVTVSVQMETPGLVVLSDLWDRGWRAYLDGRPVAILRANHAVRGVVVPPGAATLEFRYESASLAWGLRLSCFAAVILLGWLGISVWRRGRNAREGRRQPA